MKAWLQHQWRAFQQSYDPDEATAGSQPLATVGAAGAMAVVIAAVAYYPALAEGAQFRHPEIALALTAVGAITTHIAWLRRCRGRIGTAATLLDNAFYSAALTYAAVHTSGGYGLMFAVVHGLMVLAFPAQAYSLTPLFATVMLLPLALGLAAASPSSTVLVALICTYVMVVTLSQVSGRRRELLRKQIKLTQAVGAATRVADDSVQAALATTLLSLGHFLHELRNYQTAIRSNLSYIEMSADLDQDAREALADALEAQHAEEQLVTDTIDALRRRAGPNDASFRLSDVIQAAAKTSRNIVVAPADGDFVIAGLAEHLLGVLTNLARNAEQAGAQRIQIETRLEPSGRSIELTVHDDGPGIEEDKRETLFRPFVTSGKPGTTGLGLYLCQRYVELFGGTIEIADGPLGGAAFIIRLPGKRASQAERNQQAQHDAA